PQTSGQTHAGTGQTPPVTGEMPTINGSIPTFSGSSPELGDAADHDLARLPTEQELGATPRQVTALMKSVLPTPSAIGLPPTDMYIPACPQVEQDLATTAARMQLTLTAFFVGTASGQVVAGPLSDRIGRRAPLLFGIVLCLLGSIGCALAPTVDLLLVMRVVQGIGGGFGMVLG